MKLAMLGVFMVLTALALFGYVAVFQFSNPELTRTQLFLKFWPFLIAGAALGPIGITLIKSYTED